MTESTVLAEDHLVAVLTRLVRIDSVNPGAYEHGMFEHIVGLFRGTPVECHSVESLPGRRSLATVLRGSGDGPTLVLNGHMDTVPIDDPSLWSVDPFGGVVRDGCVWGRGACDMKAGLTVAIAVTQHLIGLRERMRGTLICQFAIGEECAEPGTRSLCAAGFVGDHGIVLEPTELRVATCARGLVFPTIRIRGRSVHASQVHLGVNPNTKLPAVLDAVAAYAADIGARGHPLLPPGSCVPTMIHSGVKENSLADHCDVTLDRRLLPGETVEAECAALSQRLSAIKDDDPEFDFEIIRPRYHFAPAEIAPDSPFAGMVADTVVAVTGRRTEVYGTPFASDVGCLVNEAGMEAITFGPGSVAHCHCSDERVAVEQLVQAAAVVAEVATQLLM